MLKGWGGDQEDPMSKTYHAKKQKQKSNLIN